MMDKMAEVIPAVESNIASMGKEGVSFDRFMNLALRIAIYYYRIGDDEQSHEWVKQIIDYEGSKSTIHIISYAILLDIIMHFKNGDFDYLQYRINSVQSFFKKHKRLIQVNILFFRTIKQLMRSRTMQNVDKVLDNFRTEFEECPNSLTKRYYLKYLVIEEWLDKKFDMEQRLKAYSKKY